MAEVGDSTVCSIFLSVGHGKIQRHADFDEQ
jgi:hypothetical protein